MHEKGWQGAAGAPPQRWVGYLGYDLARILEPLASTAAADLSIPLYAFAAIDNVAPRGTEARGESIKSQLTGSTFSGQEYRRAVARVIEYIAAGDVYQVNLSQRLTVRTALSPNQVYSRLMARAPAEFGALLDFGDFQIVSNSPEMFFSVAPSADGGRRIVNRPIKGTRPLGPGMERELRDSQKDRAELAMIVDLQRNDLGRVCKTGSVVVTEPRAIQRHPTVYHGVATIEGLLRPEIRFSDLLRAVFPCGSVTGCPKIRAMQIIEELEPVRRGAYCGAVGYIDADRSMQFNVAIRTITFSGGNAYVPVGGGIVADSTPEGEYRETLIKARAMLEALGIDQGTLTP